mmetsp:Transcript_97263/g.119153  ORF Transcript_97263/g.119153 Transcript_97263/m.119153 type:complete len:413 (-) Transcript_97263:208-1446(-)
MVHQPSNLLEESLLLAQVQPPRVKHTFLHYDLPSAQQVEQNLLRRHQTAPAKSCDSDSDDEGVPEPQAEVIRKAELKTTMVGNETPNLLNKEECPPVPGMLCRHTTHDPFEEGQVDWDPNVCQGQSEGHHHGMNGMQASHGSLQWEGQMGGQTCGMPMTSGTVTFMPMPIWMPPQVSHALVAQPIQSQPIDDQYAGEWQQWSQADYRDVPQQEVSPNPDALQSFCKGGLSNEFIAHPDLVQGPPVAEDSEQRFWDDMGVELLHQPQKIGRSSNMKQVYWVVDAGKLNGSAKVLVSPEFKIPSNGNQYSFKMMMHPKDQTSFRGAGGQGCVQLKCESDTQHLKSCSVTFRMGICNGRPGVDAKRDGPRNLVTWDFKRSLVCDHEEVKKTWSFKDVVDAKTRTFVVCIEILSVA